MLNILFETSVLSGGHSARGIGTYARLLTEEFKNHAEINLIKSSTLEKSDKVKADITHYPFFDLFFATLPMNPFKKLVVTIHDVIPLIFPKFYEPGIKGKLKFEKQKLALKNVNAVITDSQASKKDIIQYLNVPEEKIHVIYLAANSSIVKQEDKFVRKIIRKYKLPKKYLLYVGDINYNKNIPQLIKMMKFIEDKNIHLICVGRNFTPQEIPEWKWIETQLALSDVTDRVTFLTTIPTDPIEELAAVYSGAIAYVQPSLYEGFGLPVLEAMQCMTPAICAQNSSLVEVGGKNVIYAEPVAEALAEAIINVAGWSKTKRAKWVKDAFKWSKTFSWQKTANETIEVYKQILK